MSSAAFAVSGMSIEVFFSAPSDKANLSGVFLCGSLFDFGGASVSQCQWSSASTVLVSLPLTASIIPGDSIALRGGLLRAQCGTGVTVSFCAEWSAAPGAVVHVLPPAAPVTPSVVLAIPSLIGVCDKMIVDFVGSTGSGGRVWKSAVVSVDSLSSNITGIRDFVVTQVESKMTGRVVVPNRLLEAGFAYKWTLKLCNFLDACGVASARVAVSNSAIPLVSILGQSLRTVYRNKMFQSTSLANVCLCDGSLSSRNLHYAWGIYDATGTEIRVASISRDPKSLVLPAYTFDVAKSYRIVSTVLNTVSQLSSSATASVFVATGAIVAMISGSSTQSFRADQTFQLDGSGSHDEDDPSAALEYKWTCVRRKPVPSSTCGVKFESSDNARFLSVIALSADYITESVITLTVTGPNGRASTSAVTLSVIEPLSPLVVVSSPSNKINLFDRLQLKGYFLSTEAGVAEWSVDDESLDLSKMAATAVTVPYSQRPDGSIPAIMNLVVPAGSLFARSTFTFTLRYTTDRSVTAAASVLIITNGPPVNGVLTITPDSGEMLSTPFSISASQWQDEDLPVTYQY
ncbi:unnamed protein product, partial [Ectocarpus fasciculatus]